MRYLTTLLALLFFCNICIGQWSVLINEFDPSCPGIDTAEFVELYGTPGQNLSGLCLVIYNGSNAQSNLTIDLSGQSLDVNGFFLIGGSGISNADIIIESTNWLQVGQEGIALYAADAADFPYGTPVTNVGLVDALVYGNNQPPSTTLLSVLTPDGIQLNESAEGLADYQSLARVPDGGNALSPEGFILQDATPGLSNLLACDVDFGLDLGDWGYFPDPSLGQQFDTVQVGVPYSEVFSIAVPSAASSIDPDFQLPLDSMELLSFFLIDEETGGGGFLGDIGILTFCNNQNTSGIECTFSSGDQYCVTLAGIATEPGTYFMSIDLVAWVTVFGVGVAQPYTIDGYTLVVEGPCENDEACNYGEIGNCEFPIPPFDCSGNCLNDADSDGICDEDEILGCTYEIACNYNPNATEDDDSCEFYCPGCTDLEACNFDEGAIQDDGTCFYPEDLYGSDVVDCSGNCLNDEDLDGVCDPNEIFGCTNGLACNFIPEATEDDGACEFISCSGCTYEYACNYDPEALYSDGSCVFGECSGCTDSSACNFNPTVADDDGSCTYAPLGYDCDGSCTLDENSDGICDVGCIDSSACNYNEQATIDDGSCELPADYFDCDGTCINNQDGDGYCDELEISGCTNSIACNFDPVATDDNGLCEYCCGTGTAWNDTSLTCEIITGFGEEVCGDGTQWDPVTQTCQTMDSCPEDLDGDGIVTVSDLLQLLGSFGEACEVSVVEFTCGNPLSYQGYDYATVQIGEQCWFAENLRTEYYQNGDVIPNEPEAAEWSTASIGLQTIYGEGVLGVPDSLLNVFYSDYGLLYNNLSVHDERNICPFNWHVPSDEEWIDLEVFSGMSEVEAHSFGWRGTGIGMQLKSTSEDEPSWNGSNLSGFSALPGGNRESNGGYGDVLSYGVFWTSSENIWRDLSTDEDRVRRGQGNINGGFSVRCLKDTE